MDDLTDDDFRRIRRSVEKSVGIKPSDDETTIREKIREKGMEGRTKMDGRTQTLLDHHFPERYYESTALPNQIENVQTEADYHGLEARVNLVRNDERQRSLKELLAEQELRVFFTARVSKLEDELAAATTPEDYTIIRGKLEDIRPMTRKQNDEWNRFNQRINRLRDLTELRRTIPTINTTIEIDRARKRLAEIPTTDDTRRGKTEIERQLTRFETAIRTIERRTTEIGAPREIREADLQLVDLIKRAEQLGVAQEIQPRLIETARLATGDFEITRHPIYFAGGTWRENVYTARRIGESGRGKLFTTYPTPDMIRAREQS